jgi:multidrug efflux pump subunit AcrB
MSVSQPGMAVITVQFKVGVPRTEALVRLYDTVHANADWLPRRLGVMEPIIKPKGIDDVPVVASRCTARADAGRSTGARGAQHGGRAQARARHARGTTRPRPRGDGGDGPTRMAAIGVTVPTCQALQSANQGLPVGELLRGNQALAVQTGPFLRDAHDVAELVVGVRAGKPVYLREVAQVRDGAPPSARTCGTAPQARTPPSIRP